MLYRHRLAAHLQRNHLRRLGCQAYYYRTRDGMFRVVVLEV